MEFKIKPYHKNKYEIGAILIESPNLVHWLSILNELNINLKKVAVYPLPGETANSLFGCLVVLQQEPIPRDIGKNKVCQIVENKLIILENSIFEPQLQVKEWEILFPKHLHFIHPTLGIIVLDQPIDWSTKLLCGEDQNYEIKKPSGSIYIPKSISSYRVDIDEDEMMNALENPKSEAELLEALPFDMKKLMKGNKKELEKYLLYLEKYPDKAIDLAIPLDLIGSSRNGNNGSFSFKEGFLDKFFSFFEGSSKYDYKGGQENFSVGKILRYLFFFGIFIFLVIKKKVEVNNPNIINTLPDSTRSNPVQQTMSDTIASVPKSSITWVDKFSHYSFIDTFLVMGSVLILSIALIILFGKSTIGNKGFNKIGFSNQGNSMSDKIFSLLLITLCLTFLFHPLLKAFGLNIGIIILLIFVVLLLFRLLNNSKTILKYDDK